MIIKHPRLIIKQHGTIKNYIYVGDVSITIDMKSDFAFIAISNSPCSIQKRSTKDNRHVVVLGHLKYSKVC